MPAENPQDQIPEASATDEAAVRSLLIQQGLIEPGAGEEGASEEAAEDTATEGKVFDTPEEEAEAARLAAEAAAEGAEEGAASQGEAQAEVKAEETKEEEDPRLERAMASIARRENMLMQREKALADRERQAASILQKENQLKQTALDDPAAFFMAMGVTEADLPGVALQMYAKALGDAAPADVRAKADRAAMDRKIHAMEQREQQRQQHEQERAMIQGAYNHFAQKTIPSIPDDMAYLKNEAKVNQAAVADRLTRAWIYLRDHEGFPAEARTDEDIALHVARRVNDDIKGYVEHVRKTHLQAAAAVQATAGKQSPQQTKNPTPANGEKKAVPKSINKQATALTRPAKGVSTHEEDISSVIAALKSGRTS